MSEKVWMGSIYLKEEGGYKIVLRALQHYRNRLRTLPNSPELKDSAAMFASVLNQQAAKTIPKIDEVTRKLQDSLDDIKKINELQEEISFFEKALMSYESDIQKAQDLGHEYFVKLVGDMVKARNDLPEIKVALEKIKQFS